jgi:hypothetical protein
MATKQTCEKREYYLATRGYPQGYHSKEEYEEAIFQKTPLEKNCAICNNSFIDIPKVICCSKDCKLIARREKTQQTCQEKYGVNNPRQNKDIVEKGIKTCLRKYGVENPQQYADIKERTKETCLKKYGNICHLNSKEYADKRAQTLLDTIGVDNYFKRHDLIIESYQRVFGNEITNPLQVKSIQEKVFNTRKSLYELKGSVPKEASEKTCLERYGHKSFFGSERGRMSLSNLKENHGWTDEELLELSKKRRGFVRFGRASKESLKIFIPLYKWLRKKGYKREDIMMGVNGSCELSLIQNNKVVCYDFTIIPLNIIIEFNGVKFHARTLTDHVIRGSAEKSIKSDEFKKMVAENNDYSLLTIWSDEFNLLNNCKQFILQKEGLK